MVLGGDISIPNVPEIIDLTNAWGSKLTGSPPMPAFPSPTFAQVAAGKPYHRTSNKTVVCQYCEMKFNRDCELHDHLSAVHDFQKQRSTVDNKKKTKSETKRNPSEKQQEDHKSRTFKCDKCKFTSVSGKGLFYHKRQAHKKTPSPESALSSADSKLPTVKNTLPLSLLDGCLVATFPIADIIPCPFGTCDISFGTVDWSRSLAKCQNHLVFDHEAVIMRVKQVCSKCKQEFLECPAEHHCFVQQGYQLASAPATSTSYDVCKSSFKTAKGLKHHILQKHGVKRESTAPIPPPKKAQEESATVSVPQTSTNQTNNDNTQNTASLEAQVEVKKRSVAVKNQQSAASPLIPGVHMSDGALHYAFPLPLTIDCPVPGCKHNFHTQKWYTSSASVKRHLTAFHRKANLPVVYWCTLCKKRIRQPANHICLKTSALNTGSAVGDWQCEVCSFTAASKLGLQNHAMMHKRQAIAATLPSLNLPISTKAKKAKKKKLDPISSGDPRESRLAPSGSDAPQQNTTIPCEDSSLTGRGLTCHLLPYLIASTNHWRFFLKSTKLTGSGSTLKISLTILSQRYKTTSNCNGLHHLMADKRLALIHEVPDPTVPPERPPVLEQLSESFVAACLKSSENSAPGPDLISTGERWTPRAKFSRRYLPEIVRYPCKVEGIVHDPDSKGR
ncbi:hypothetical protein TNIN_95411 [Trichonephila inaurata madagascariensis]|uniref:C2H2-type domain-containing protein n=1 Tax=Trichonephila inaurata madagascariensis TaxID=2747483 RepID=A0A8X6YG02_9ARAC|nr:hypothetical protein TNIN_95411 [Trichonephila inaurata madagascariensis]